MNTMPATHTPSAVSRIAFVSSSAFQEHIRQAERLLNAGVRTRWDSLTNNTQWTIGRLIVGVTQGQIGETTRYQVVPF